MIGKGRSLIRVLAVAAGVLLAVRAAHADPADPASGADMATRASPSYWFRVLIPGDQVPSQIGYASFRKGGDDVLVFAADLPVSLEALRAVSGVPGAQVVHLAGATILRLPLPEAKPLGVLASATSFHILIGDAPAPEPVVALFRHGQIRFPTTVPGRVVAVEDADRQRPLLVGTVTGPVALRARLEGPGYRSVPASSGVVIAPVADDLGLVADKDGFVLRADGAALPVGDPPVSQQRVDAPEQAGGLDLPHGSILALRHRLDREQRQWAAAPPLDRVRQSLRIARTMLSLDLAPEAHGVLIAMLGGDPAAIDNPERGALMAVADLLSGRPDKAMAHWPEGQGVGDERSLWLGIAAAAQGHDKTAAALLADHMAPLAAAPALVRHQVDPLVAEALVRGGALAAAQRVADRMQDDPTTHLIRAEIEQASHHPRHAIADYRKLVDSADPRVAGIAAFRETMLQRALGLITPHDAAARLAQHLYDWRGPRHELDMRLALARLRAEDGAWPEAFTGLHTALRLFPHRTARIAALRHHLFDRMIASGALDRLPVLAAVSLIENNHDLVPAGAAGVPIVLDLSRKLAALDLADQAEDVLARALSGMPDGQDRARLGAALARLQLSQNHPHLARKTLDSTAGAGLAAKVADARLTLAAEIARQIGPGSAQPMSGSGGTTGVAWVPTLGRGQRPIAGHPAIHRAMSAVPAVPAIPAEGRLDDAAAETVLQSAIAASREHDGPKLAALRARYPARMPHGKEAAVFAAATSPPVAPTTDLATALAQIAEIERAGRSLAPNPKPAKPQ
ncbi:MAG: hypothetical protein PHI71_05265 [Acidiphilium sp.]|nr:hypothetical protein [Acidiphilium sp.]